MYVSEKVSVSNIISFLNTKYKGYNEETILKEAIKLDYSHDIWRCMVAQYHPHFKNPKIIQRYVTKYYCLYNKQYMKSIFLDGDRFYIKDRDVEKKLVTEEKPKVEEFTDCKQTRIKQERQPLKETTFKAEAEKSLSSSPQNKKDFENYNFVNEEASHDEFSRSSPIPEHCISSNILDQQTEMETIPEKPKLEEFIDCKQATKKQEGQPLKETNFNVETEESLSSSPQNEKDFENYNFVNEEASYDGFSNSSPIPEHCTLSNTLDQHTEKETIPEPGLDHADGNVSNSNSAKNGDIKQPVLTTTLNFSEVQYFPKKTGIINYGTTCYMNSVLQALFHLPSKEWLSWLRSNNQCQPNTNVEKCVGCALCKTFKLYEQQTNSSITPSLLYDMIPDNSNDVKTNSNNSIFKEFSKKKQQDSHEFLLSIMDGIKKCRPQALFDGLTCTITTCEQCKRPSEITEFLKVLTLPIHKNTVSIQNALDVHLSTTTLVGYKCDPCNIFATASQKIVFKNLPDVFIIHINRFDERCEKITYMIDCEPTLELVDYAGNEIKYELSSIIEHYGNTKDSGHYITKAKTAANQYHKFDDSTFSRANIDFFTSNENIYIAFYKKVAAKKSCDTKDTNSSEHTKYFPDHNDSPPSSTLPSNHPSSENQGNNVEHKFTNNPPILLESNFWSRYVPEKGRRLKGQRKSDWTNDFCNEFKKVYPLCVLAFDTQKLYLEEKKKNNQYWVADALCTITSCREYRFIVEERIQVPHTDHFVKVYTSKAEIDHSSGENCRRFCAGSRRDELREELKKKPPAMVKWDLLNKTSEQVLSEGNLNDTPSLTILNKINSELRACDDLDKDYYLFMQKLQQKLHNELGTRIKGYIQHHSVFPIMIVLFTEMQLRCLAKQSPIFLNIDATGTIAATPKYCQEKMNILYYKISIAGSRYLSPLEVCEAILSNHNETSIKMFMMLWLSKFREISCKKIAKIESDFSLALLKPACSLFNNIDLYTFMNMIFDQIENGKEITEFATVLHVCSSHFIKSVRTKIKACFPDKNKQKKERLVATLLISEIIHSRNFEEACPYFMMFVKLYANKKKTDDQGQILYTILKDEHTDDDSKEVETEGEAIDFIIDEEEEVKKAVSKKNESKYHLSFKKLQERTIVTYSNLTHEVNSFFSEKLVKYFVEYLAVYYPLWSAVYLCRFGLRRDSNASAENGFKILKHTVFKNEKRVLIPRLIQQNSEVIKAKLKERSFSLRTTRQGEKRPIEKEETESWQKRTNKKRMPNKYFKMDKQVNRPRTENTEKNSAQVSAENTHDHLKKEERTEFIDIEENIEEQLFDREEVLQKESTADENTARIERQIFTCQDVDEFLKSYSHYPPNFPYIHNEINGIIIDSTIFSRLSPLKSTNEYLCDEIVNSFLSLLPEVARTHGLNLISFSSLLVGRLIHEKVVTAGFDKWLKDEKVASKDIWLIPVNHTSLDHWALIVVINSLKTIVYIDSMRSQLPKNVVISTMVLIKKGKKFIDWNEWKLYEPTDINQQIRNNCGVYMLIWALSIATSSHKNLREEEIQQSRISIANTIYYSVLDRKKKSRDEKIKNSSYDSMSYEESEKNIDMVTIINQPPLGFNSTAEFCNSLKLIVPELFRKTRNNNKMRQ